MPDDCADNTQQYEFHRRMSAEEAHEPKCLEQSLRESGAVLVDNVGDTASLRSIAAMLGPLTAPGVGMKANLHDEGIYRVQVRNQGAGVRDTHGHLILSTTNSQFPLHTDGYNSASPPKFILLRREDKTSDKTESIIADGRLAIRRIRSDVVETLLEPIFPFALGTVAILTRRRNGFGVRFNTVELDRWGLSASATSAQCAVQEFYAALSGVASTFVIQPHQCLILDNHRMCHGRSRVNVDSARVLQRLWIS